MSDERLLIRLDFEPQLGARSEPTPNAVADTAHAFADAPGVKIATRGAGLVRVDAEALLAAGLDAGLDPRRLRLFRQGREIGFTVGATPSFSHAPSKIDAARASRSAASRSIEATRSSIMAGNVNAVIGSLPIATAVRRCVLNLAEERCPVVRRRFHRRRSSEFR